MKECLHTSKMSSSELELARNYLTLTKKVHDSKKAELMEAMALVTRLQEQVVMAEHDLRNARLCLEQVERKLEVVDVDDSDYEENRHPREGVPLVPPLTNTMRRNTGHSEFPMRSHDELSEKVPDIQETLGKLLFRDSSITHEFPIPASLRRSLLRYQRKILRLSERPCQGHRHEN